MSGIEPEIEFACDRETPGGLRVTYDDGQNVRVEGVAPCPWCGPAGRPDLRPYVQVRGTFRPSCEARVVCPTCHVATTHVWQDPAHVLATDEDVTRDLAIEKAVNRWNRRDGGREGG